MRTAAIVLDWFGAESTRRCLRSLSAEPLSACYVVDNSGDDEAHARLLQVLEEVAVEWPGVALRVLRAPQNLGFAAGVNLAVAADRAQAQPHDFLLLINNDAEARAGLLPALLLAAAAAGGPCLLGVGVEDGAGGLRGMRGYHRWLALNRDHLRAGYEPYLSGCCLGLPAALATAEGLFDPAFFMYGEDVELSWRLRSAGVELRCVESACVTHPARQRGGLFYEYHVARGHLLLASRLARSPLELPLLLLARLPVLGLRALWRALRQRSAAPLLGLLLAPLNLGLRPRRGAKDCHGPT